MTIPQLAIITGATKGIGLALAHRFASSNWNIAVTARSAKDLDNLQLEFQRKYPDIRVFTYPVDHQHKTENLAFVQKVLKEFESVDVLINNAALFEQGPLTEEPDGLLEKMMAVNVLAPYDLTRALLPKMQKQGRGHIFNICSVASQQAFGDRGAYTVSKHALLGFSRALRASLKGTGICVTAVLPGPVRTSSWEGIEMPDTQLMPPEGIANAIYNAWSLGPQTVLEELLLRPQEGDL